MDGNGCGPAPAKLGEVTRLQTIVERQQDESDVSRRQFLQASAIAGAGLALPKLRARRREEIRAHFHQVFRLRTRCHQGHPGHPSILEQAVRTLGEQHGFEVTATKDGRIFDSSDFKKYAALLFFTTGDLTTVGTDGNPAMSPAGKQALLDAIHGGLGFVGVHAASDTFHTEPDPKDNSNRYIAHGANSDPYLKMLGGEFITHGSTPRLQEANLIVEDARFPASKA